MPEIFRWLIKFYGNRGFLFEVGLSFLITFFSLYLILQSNIKFAITNEFFYSLIGFFGVLVGFLLTAFSLLYIYNPTESEQLSSFRKDNLFTDMLKAFLSAILFIFLSIILLYGNISLGAQSAYVNYLIFPILLLTSLRIAKCMYYLFVIIEIGNVSRDSTGKTD